uniref:glutathione transferase n=1 Tax=Plectus sambesii TaxID=2011161 RepID=A0A914W3C5_9BILA
MKSIFLALQDAVLLTRTYGGHYLKPVECYNGKNDWEAAQIQELMTVFDDLGPKLYPTFFEKDETKKVELMKTAAEEHVKPYYARLQKYLEENGTGYFVGNDLTVADILHFVFLTGIDEGIFPGVLAEYPKLTAFVEHIQAIPKIKEWLEKRPEAPFSILSKKKQ